MTTRRGVMIAATEGSPRERLMINDMYQNMTNNSSVGVGLLASALMSVELEAKRRDAFGSESRREQSYKFWFIKEYSNFPWAWPPGLRPNVGGRCHDDP